VKKHVEFHLAYVVEDTFYACISDFRWFNRSEISLCQSDKTVI